jgi:hypothetical protein
MRWVARRIDFVALSPFVVPPAEPCPRFARRPLLSVSGDHSRGRHRSRDGWAIPLAHSRSASGALTRLRVSRMRAGHCSSSDQSSASWSVSTRTRSARSTCSVVISRGVISDLARKPDALRRLPHRINDHAKGATGWPVPTTLRHVSALRYVLTSTLWICVSPAGRHDHQMARWRAVPGPGRTQIHRPARPPARFHPPPRTLTSTGGWVGGNTE